MQAKKYRMTKHIENNAFEAHDQEKRQNVRFENEKKKKKYYIFLSILSMARISYLFYVFCFSFRNKKVFSFFNKLQHFLTQN